MAKASYYIDQNEQFPIRLEHVEEGEHAGEVRVTIDLTNHTNPKFLKNIQSFSKVQSGNAIAYFHVEKGKPNELVAYIAPEGSLIDLRFNEQKNPKPLLSYFANDFAELRREGYGKLASFETRMLGRSDTETLRNTVPFDRNMMGDIAPHRERYYPKTELHSHLTSEIHGSNLIKIAAKNHAPYPVELFEAMGIDRDRLPDRTIPMKPVEFAPMGDRGLPCEQKDGENVEGIDVAEFFENPEAPLEDLKPKRAYRKLVQEFNQALEVPPDSVYTFDGLERKLYRFRNPLTKNSALIEPIILAVAQQYDKEGIHYTEQAVTGALNPQWLSKAIPALEKAKELYNVDMRFLVGIPRNFDPIRMKQEIRKVEHIAQSPYIVGVDFLGYESNKTESFASALRDLAKFASQREKRHDPETGEDYVDFTLRIHAGETKKNSGNVMEAMKIADKYNVPLRIGHGIHVNFNDEFKTLASSMAKRGILAVEFNPDSNIATNNIDKPSDIPINEWRSLGVPFVISSDGSGAYQTTSQELVQSMLAAGATVQDLENINTFERAFIKQRELAFDFREEESMPFDALINSYKEINQAIERLRRKVRTVVEQKGEQPIPDELKSKTPVLIAGASGSSWKNISAEDQQEIEIGVRMLTELLDPKKAYFCCGRLKDSGITHSLFSAIADYEQSHENKPPFSLMALLADMNDSKIPEQVSDIRKLEGGLMAVPTEMVDYIKEQKGMAIYAGGGAFTRDFILNSSTEEIPHGIMNGPYGASTEKSQICSDDKQFMGAMGMVEHVQEMAQKLNRNPFKDKEALTEESLSKLYQRIKTEVEQKDPRASLVSGHAARMRRAAAREDSITR